MRLGCQVWIGIGCVVCSISCSQHSRCNELVPASLPTAPATSGRSFPDLDGFVSVAFIEGCGNGVRGSVAEQLNAAGIECVIEGSLSYRVSVSPKEASRAREILRRSTRIDHDRVRVVD